MTAPSSAFRPYVINPTLDLVLERDIDVPVDLVWAAWTQPEHLKHWFCPQPWSVSDCEIDLRPGGKFNTTMRAPDGQLFPNEGCYLEIVPGQRLIFTDALRAGFRPSNAPFMTGIIEMQPNGSGTRYRAIAIHFDEAARQKHNAMGFHDGWSTALDQLIAHMTNK